MKNWVKWGALALFCAVALRGDERPHTRSVYATTFIDSSFAYGGGYEKGLLAAAMPSGHAKGKRVRVTHPTTKKSVVVPVLDKGPWVIHDDNYVLNGARPWVETNQDTPIPLSMGGSQVGRKPVSIAALDLTPEVWFALGVRKSYVQLLKHSERVIIEWFI
jgi:hypothetical protein